jgi:hypothetical protein
MTSGIFRLILGEMVKGEERVGKEEGPTLNLSSLTFPLEFPHYSYLGTNGLQREIGEYLQLYPGYISRITLRLRKV